MEMSEIRRRVRAAIEESRRDAAERRARTDAALKAYDSFLIEHAVPAFQQFAAALQGEGLRFRVETPADSVRLTADGAPGDYVEVGLDRDADPPTAAGRISRGRGRRAVTYERPVRGGAPVAELSSDDVIEFLLSEVPSLLHR